MKIQDQTNQPSLRYWGYEPASAENLHSAAIPYKDRAPIRDQYKNERAMIRTAGFKPSNMGYRSQFAAKMAAAKIEKATGVEMMIFRHDYL